MAAINRLMFREYDLRGRESQEELNENSMYLVGLAYGTFLRKRGITKSVIGHDARATSRSFHDAVVRGLVETGIEVISCGMIVTPQMYWAQYFLKSEGGVMVTASHNPAGWNGVKLALGYSYTLIGPELMEIYQTIVDEKFAQGKGSLRRVDIKNDYIKDLLSRVKITKNFRVLVNTGNGTAGAIVPDLLKAAGCEVVGWNLNIDPTYPNYTPNPAETVMMEDTASQTVKNGCHLGFAFDGDGDRLGLVDEKGKVIPPDRYLILLSRLVLKRKPGSKIVFDGLVSNALPEDIRAHGGVPIMWKTGHSYIKAKLAEEQAALAGEVSGHIFFVEDFYGFDDAQFAALKILEYLSSTDKSLSEEIAATPYYRSTPVFEVDCPDDRKYEIVAAIAKEFEKEGAKINTLNGVRVDYEDGWGILRASSNLPTLKLRFEAKTDEGIERIKRIFQAKMAKYEEIGKVWRTG